MAAADGAIVKMLQAIFDYVHEDGAAQAMQQQAETQDIEHQDDAAASSFMGAAAVMQQPAYASRDHIMQQGPQPYVPQLSAQLLPAAYQSQQQGTSQYFSETAYPPSNTLYAPEQQQFAAVWPQQHFAGAQHPIAVQQAQQHYSNAASMSQHVHYPPSIGAVPQQAMPDMQQGASLYTGAHASNQHSGASMPSIEYDRRPRAVDYKPYTQQDYSSRNYDAKTQKEYWMLGTLGPQIEDEDLQVLMHRGHSAVPHVSSIRLGGLRVHRFG